MFNIFNFTLPCTVSVLIVASQRERKYSGNVHQLATNRAFPLYLVVSMNSPTFTNFPLKDDCYHTWFHSVMVSQMTFN